MQQLHSFIESFKARTFDAFEGIIGLVVLLWIMDDCFMYPSHPPLLFIKRLRHKQKDGEPAQFQLSSHLQKHDYLIEANYPKMPAGPLQNMSQRTPELLFRHPLKLKLFVIIR
ncbi:hypothetical protein CW734_09395 [Planococcus sp. MB-3u-03]|nr:hypothetical protein CW734_09395 [Planococcus sp. MB-3u-03]